MSQIIDAIYENGHFRPLAPIALAEHELVRLSIIRVPESTNAPSDAADAQRRAAIAARIPSDHDLELLSVPPPAEWLAEKDWQ